MPRSRRMRVVAAVLIALLAAWQLVNLVGFLLLVWIMLQPWDI
ncbi:MAG: hypothetical protein ACK5LS_11340 [Propioniciclava sp.]